MVSAGAPVSTLTALYSQASQQPRWASAASCLRWKNHSRRPHNPLRPLLSPRNITTLTNGQTVHCFQYIFLHITVKPLFESI